RRTVARLRRRHGLGGRALSTAPLHLVAPGERQRRVDHALSLGAARPHDPRPLGQALGDRTRRGGTRIHDPRSRRRCGGRQERPPRRRRLEALRAAAGSPRGKDRRRRIPRERAAWRHPRLLRGGLAMRRNATWRDHLVGLVLAVGYVAILLATARGL